MTNNPTPETARRDRYAAALRSVRGTCASAESAVMTVADAEQAQLRTRIAELESSCRDTDRLRKDWVEMRDRVEELDERAKALAAATVPAPAPTEFELRGTGEIRATALIEAADFLRNAHFREGLTVQEIGTAMRHWADRERADTEPVSGPGGVAGETQQPETQATPPVERCALCHHPKRDHDGRADHRAKFSPLVAGDPWCHACNAACDYAEQPAAVSQPGKEPTS